MTSPLELRIERVEAARLAQELADLTNEPIDELVIALLQERLAREKRRASKARRDRRVTAQRALRAERPADYPVVDDRSPREAEWPEHPDWPDGLRAD